MVQEVEVAALVCEEAKHITPQVYVDNPTIYHCLGFGLGSPTP